MKFIDRGKTNSEKYTLRKKLFGTDDVIPLWVADMDIATPKCVLDSIQKRLAHPILGYEMMPKSAYQAQIDWMQKRHNYNIKREWMMFSPSVVASISLAIKAFSNNGDNIIVQTPVYPPFFKQIEINDREVLCNPLKKNEMGDYSFDFEDLKSKINSKTKLLLLCSPHNPVGRVWRKQELEELANICLDNNILVFADEIHSDLVYKPHIHTPFASISKEVEAITISANGIGKTFNLAGANISTIQITNDLLRQMFKNEVSKIHFGEGNTLGHIAFEEAYKNGDTWLDNILEHLENNAKKLKTMIDKHQDKISFNIPEGTYLAWLNCTKMGLSDEDLRSFFIKKAKLGLGYGKIFGKNGSAYMRLNFAISNDAMDLVVNNLDLALQKF